jgi:hypothetical protein
MPPLASWFGPRDEIARWLATSPMSGDWHWRAIRTQANGQVALAFYSLDPDEDAYMPFALNVLTFRGPEISEVDAFIVRTPTAPDRATAARMPEQPTNVQALAAAFENLGMPEKLER